MHFKSFPKHEIFMKKLNEGKEKATKTGSRVYVNWRGYRVFVNPGKKRLTKDDFIRHLTSALKAIKLTTAAEKKVSKFFKKKIHIFRTYFLLILYAQNASN